ncbi:prohibitin family protein [Thiothrix lacustris]|uniref:prohibitin family protein n=1 Tax=Thiothrix lacustris TaxID=525917 RepID=UPI0027E475FE|nr:prohibitin family protein [Thiothrix lacustris]WMP19443.1 prohibitin family protein [Thiothrix lacustris]
MSNPQTNTDVVKPTPTRKRFWGWLLFWAGLLALLLNTPFIVKEGYVGILNRIDQTQQPIGTGIHLKIPLLESVQLLETRTRLASQPVQAFSQEQLALTLKVSAHWHVQPAQGLAFYREFQTPEQFENRILLPQLQAITSKIIGQHDVATLLGKQDSIIQDIYQTLNKTILTNSLHIDSIQLDNIVLPEAYQKSVEAMLTEQNLANTERLKADKDKARVNAQLETAEAEKTIKQTQADADAYVTLKKGEAEAQAIRLQVDALQQNRTVVDYLRVRKWDGKLAPGMDGKNTWKLPGE